MITPLKIALMLCVTSIFGQNVKVKKDILSIDKTEVCKFSSSERNHYEIQDLEGNSIMNVEYATEDVQTLCGNEQFRYLKFTKQNSDEVYYSDFDVSTFKISLSGTKNIARQLIVNDEFLSEAGINYDKINAFFS